MNKRWRRSDVSPPPRKTSRDITGRIEEWHLGLPLPEDVQLPAAHDDRVTAALNALKQGTATPEQQTLGMSWVVWSLGTYHNPYRSSPYDTANLSGRQRGGQHIVNVMNMRPRQSDNTEQG